MANKIIFIFCLFAIAIWLPVGSITEPAQAYDPAKYTQGSESKENGFFSVNESKKKTLINSSSVKFKNEIEEVRTAINQKAIADQDQNTITKKQIRYADQWRLQKHNRRSHKTESDLQRPTQPDQIKAGTQLSRQSIQQLDTQPVSIPNATPDPTTVQKIASPDQNIVPQADPSTRSLEPELPNKAATIIPAVFAEPPTQTVQAEQPASQSFLSLDQLRDDVAPQDVLKNDYALAAPVDPGYDWFNGSRPGGGPNPPPGFSAQTGWGEIFTNRDNPPGPHNWGVAILRMVELEERDGSWRIIRDTTDPELLKKGMRIVEYAPTQTSGPIESRIKDGKFEIKLPDEGGIYHNYLTQLTISDSGATNRMVLIQTGMVVWDESKPDDRQEAIAQGKAAVMHVGIDYWRYAGAPFVDGYSNNDDMGIGRASVIGMIEDPSWHSQHSIAYSNTAELESALKEVTALIAPQ